MSSASLLLLIAACVVLCNGYKFSGNLTRNDIKKNQWNYKATTASGFNFPLISLGASFSAGEHNGKGRVGSVERTYGAGYVNLGGFPFAWLAYFKIEHNITVTGHGAASVDVSKSAGYMGHASLWLEERTPEGSVASYETLQWQLGGNDGLSYSLTEASKSKDVIQFVTFTGVSNNAATKNFNVSITYLATSVAGVVAGDGIEDVRMVPGSIESIIRINNYPYVSTNNSLSLVSAVATGAASISRSGHTVYSEDNQVYFSMAKQGYVAGNKIDVIISAFEAGNFTVIGSDDIQIQVKGKYGAAADVKLVSVSFPAGAMNIAYDPSIGAGTPATDAGSASTGAATSLVLIFIAMVVSLL